jgi:hypothetical protein
MSKAPPKIMPPRTFLNDPRSTGTAIRPPPRDINALRGTLTSRPIR